MKAIGTLTSEKLHSQSEARQTDRRTANERTNRKTKCPHTIYKLSQNMFATGNNILYSLIKKR